MFPPPPVGLLSPSGAGPAEPNGSGLAVGRTLIALLENNYDGSEFLNLPKHLEPYFGSDILKLS